MNEDLFTTASTARVAARLEQNLAHLLTSAGVAEQGTSWLVPVVLALATLILAALAHWLTHRVLIRLVQRVVQRSRVQWDDILFEKHVFSRLAQLAPAFIVYLAAPLVLGLETWATGGVQAVALIYMVGVVIVSLDGLLSAIQTIYDRFAVARDKPIKGYVQVGKIVVYVLGGVSIVSLALGRSPFWALSGIGAVTAVLMLVFKDSILGFVANIQLTANNMVRVGDWIEMPQYGADGDVLDISITTVKVQNWDKTIATIPTYALVNGSFKNWKGMSAAQGRRIKRAVRIDLSTIRFCDETMLRKFQKFERLRDYLAPRLEEIERWNAEHGGDLSETVNGRRLTNIGTFRAYLERYLRAHPKIHQTGLTLMVRQLAPTEHGLPIEIYCFTTDTAWVNYEAIQADIFDHILAVVPEFDLRAYQTPSGRDVERLASGSDGSSWEK